MENKKKWLETGYQHFAESGPENLSIKRIAQEIQIPRSTFYNYFADRQDMIENLLQIYLNQVIKYKELLRDQCKSYAPDMFELVEQFSPSLKFSRQLFLHRQNPVYNMVFLKVRKQVNEYSVPLFMKYYAFNIHYKVVEDLYDSLTDSWYSKLNPDDLTAESMLALNDEIMESVLKFVKSKLFMQMQ